MCSVYWNAMDFTATDPHKNVREWLGRYEGSSIPKNSFVVKGGDLGFAVSVFVSFAIIALTAIRVKRVIYGGELGGPQKPKVVIAVGIMSLWFLYVIFAIIATTLEDVGSVLMIVAMC